MEKTKNGMLVVPEGYTAIEWRKTQNGCTVYLAGKVRSEPHAYGPFTVHDKSQRKLKNRPGNIFMHYPEELLVKKEA